MKTFATKAVSFSEEVSRTDECSKFPLLGRKSDFHVQVWGDRHDFESSELRKFIAA